MSHIHEKLRETRPGIQYKSASRQVRSGVASGARGPGVACVRNGSTHDRGWRSAAREAPASVQFMAQSWRGATLPPLAALGATHFVTSPRQAPLIPHSQTYSAWRRLVAACPGYCAILHSLL